MKNTGMLNMSKGLNLLAMILPSNSFPFATDSTLSVYVGDFTSINKKYRERMKKYNWSENDGNFVYYC